MRDFYLRMVLVCMPAAVIMVFLIGLAAAATADGEQGTAKVPAPSPGFVVENESGRETIPRGPSPAAAYDAAAALQSEPYLLWGACMGATDIQFDNFHLDSSGNTYFTGHIWGSSSDLPGPAGFCKILAGGVDIFIVKLNSGGEVAWVSYLGGSGDDWFWDSFLDPFGTLIIAGSTTSPNFPVTAGFEDTLVGPPDNPDAFIARIAPDGRLDLCRCLGGRYDDFITDVVVSPSGEFFVCGGTQSPDFPTPGGFDTAYDGGNGGYFADGFAARLSARGQLEWATFLGASGWDTAWKTCLHADEHITVCGTTTSPNFPVFGAFQGDFGGYGDAFIVSISPFGQLLWASYFGGADDEHNCVPVPLPGGDLLLTGDTCSSDLPLVNAFQTHYGGKGDAFAARVSSAGELLWSSYLGGARYDRIESRLADDAGNVFVAGQTYSSDLPVKAAFQSIHAGDREGFVGKITPAGELDWLTYVGGGGEDYIHRISREAPGALLATGYSESPDFPLERAFDTDVAQVDAIITKITENGELVWSTFLGGNGLECGYDTHVDAQGIIHVAGLATSSNFPTPGGFNLPAGAGCDFFAVKILDHEPWFTCLVPSDGAALGASVTPAFRFMIAPVVTKPVIAFSTSNDFPVQPAGRPDGQIDRSLRYRLPGNLTSWTPTRRQWKSMKRVALPDERVLYWRLEGNIDGLGAVCGPTRTLRFDTGCVSDLSVFQLVAEPPTAPAGEDAVWPDKAAQPVFCWSDHTVDMKYFYLDVSVDPSMPMSDSGRSLTMRANPFRRILPGQRRALRRLATWRRTKKLSQPPNGVLYWRVRALDADRVLPYACEPRKLTFDAGIWTVSDLDLAADPAILSWQHVGSGIVSYGIEFCWNDGFEPPVRETLRVPARRLAGNSHSFSDKEKAALKRFAASKGVTSLYYRVRGQDADGAFAAYSPAKTVSIQ